MRKIVGIGLCIVGIHSATAFAPFGVPAGVQVVPRASGMLLTGAAFPAPAAQVDLAVAEKIKKGVKELARGGSLGPVPIEEIIVGVIDDGSVESKSALAGVAASGAKAAPIPYKGNVAEAQATYKEKGCTTCIVKNTKQMRELMSGQGLNCKDCSLVGDEAPPKWFIVMNSNGKSPHDLEEEGGVAGRECEVTKDGSKICFQVGISVATYGADAPYFDTLKINPKSGYRQAGEGGW